MRAPWITTRSHDLEIRSRTTGTSRSGQLEDSDRVDHFQAKSDEDCGSAFAKLPCDRLI